MALPRHILACFMIIILFSMSCFGSDVYFPSYLGDIEDVEFGEALLKIRPYIFTSRNGHHRHRGRRRATNTVVNVSDFGAKGDGITDDTKAFKKAWEEVCSSEIDVVLEVPRDNNYLLKPIKFSGPCKSDVSVQIRGTLKASDDLSDYKKDATHWLVFSDIQNLKVGGGGTVEGNGEIWWDRFSKNNKHHSSKDAPTALTFRECNNLMVNSLNIQNAGKMHLVFDKCSNVEASNLTVTAPRESPNTDGIHVTHSQEVQISSSVIGTGDDCISIVSGSKNVRATEITCGPGHGISVGSLGAKYSEAHVSNVTVDGAVLSGTTNGVRIKTWPGGSGSAKHIRFMNIEMHNVENPIIINQSYCDKQDDTCEERKSAVQVKDVLYMNIKGTSATDEAIKFVCSKNFPCQGIKLRNISLERKGGESAKALCQNVKFQEIGNVSPHCHSEKN